MKKIHPNSLRNLRSPKKGERTNTGKTHFKKGNHPKTEFKKGHKLGVRFKKGFTPWNKNKKGCYSEEQLRKMSLVQKGIQAREKHWNWKGGNYKCEYPREFNYELKFKIRNRDNFTCCLCGKTEREEFEELNRSLCVNHIDFNKNNCKESNLNTLCLRCNVKINREREYWTDYFKINE